jgi:hypothetical protein
MAAQRRRPTLSADSNLIGVLAEVAKAGFFGACGWGLKWATAKHSAQAQGVRDCLALIDTIAGNAEKAARLIRGGQTDHGLSVAVLSARTGLGQALNRAVGRSPGYVNVRTSLGLFGAALLIADWNSGAAIDDASIEQIAERQMQLREAVHNAAEQTIAWKLFRHPSK